MTSTSSYEPVRHEHGGPNTMHAHTTPQTHYLDRTPSCPRIQENTTRPQTHPTKWEIMTYTQRAAAVLRAAARITGTRWAASAAASAATHAYRSFTSSIEDGLESLEPELIFCTAQEKRSDDARRPRYDEPVGLAGAD